MVLLSKGFVQGLVWYAFMLAGVLLVGCGEPPPYERTPGVHVHHYDVDLTLSPERRSLAGTTTLHLTYPDTLETLTFSFSSRMRVDSVMVDGRTVTARHRRGRLQLPSPAQSGGQSTQVEVAYHGRPSEGVYRETYAGEAVIFSDGWPERIRGWIPGAHHPSDAATATLTLTAPLGYRVEASGALATRDTLDDQVRSQFELSTPVPTYAMAFAAGNYVQATDTAAWNDYRWPVHYTMLEADEGHAERLHHLPEAMALFSDLIGPYPFTSYATVQVPFGYAGMENAAASFVRADLFGSSGSGDIDLFSAEAVAVHELAHQWFGNFLSLAEWRDLWLSEGMATYLTTLYYEMVQGEEVAHALRARLARPEGSWRRWRGPLVPEGEVHPQRHLSPVIYNRGATVLHLLRLVVGDEAFFGGLRTIYQTHAARPLSTSAFKHAMELQSGIELQSFFDAWVYGQRVPALHTRWNAETRTLNWELDEDDPWIEDAPVLLQVTQGGTQQYVPLADYELTLDAASPTPEVSPVGVMIRIRD